jgi:hypothetical protein
MGGLGLLGYTVYKMLTGKNAKTYKSPSTLKRDEVVAILNELQDSLIPCFSSLAMQVQSMVEGIHMQNRHIPLKELKKEVKIMIME